MPAGWAPTGLDGPSALSAARAAERATTVQSRWPGPRWARRLLPGRPSAGWRCSSRPRLSSGRRRLA
eukprot:5029178-Alexandrium_andersonii.AAC.1